MDVSTSFPHHRFLRFVFIVLFSGLVLGLSAAIAQAQGPMVPAPPSVAASGYLLIDIDTQRVLAEENSREALPPASLTKIMTSYVAAEELTAGRISLDDEVPVSVKAWRTPGSRMFIREGTQVPVRDLLKGIIIQSGNDASVALAEHIAGSEDAFALMMNQAASRLGLKNTQYRNATGLPDDEHYTTAADLATLTRALIEQHAATYAIYAERSFRYNDIEQPNRNRLLWRDKTVDGVKTGHTDAAGYCLVASAERDDMRLISVVMGTDSDEARMLESQKLLKYGFRYFETRRPYQGQTMLKDNEIFYGASDTVPLGVAEDVYVTIPRGHYNELEAELEVPAVLEAPVAAGEEVGELLLTLGGEKVFEAPLIALEAVPEAGVFSQVGDFFSLFFRELFGD